MKKAELVERLAAFTQTTKKDAAATLAALKQIAEIEMANGRTFEIHGIIELSVQSRAARRGRNPATGEVVDIPARQVIRPRIPGSLIGMVR